MTKPNALQAALAKSLKPAKTTKPVAAVRVLRVPGTVAVGIATKLSVSLHPADLAKLAEVQRLLAEAGKYGVTTSEALKIAVRGFSPTAKAVAELYESLKADDQRRK